MSVIKKRSPLEGRSIELGVLESVEMEKNFLFRKSAILSFS
jgi:hypothetical protein